MASAGSSGFETHLIEVNTNQALHVSDGQRLKELLPPLVRGAIDIVLDEHGVEDSLPGFSSDRAQFARIYDEQKNFRFLGKKEWVRRFSDASDTPSEE